METTCTNFPICWRQTTKTTSKCDTNSLGPVCQLWFVNYNCMRDSKPQRCVQQHNSFKVARNATNPNKHINEASKQAFANNLLKIFSKYTQSILSNWKICCNVINTRTYDELLCNLSNILKLSCKRPVLTSQFDVKKLQKQLQTVKQIHLNQSANFGPLILFVCRTISYKVAVSSINHLKWHEIQQIQTNT